jgi:long-chain fatty acid transport protein
MKTLKYVLFAAVVASPAVASANAFNINEHDAAATGRGGATAASNISPSSVMFNPGGIAVREGTNFQIGGSVILAKGAYTLEGGEKTKTDSAPAIVPNVFITSRLSDLVGVGVGLHFPFGSSISWPDGHPQADVIQDQTLRTFFITPSIGLNLDKQVPGLSIGGGVDIVPATVELERAVIFADMAGTAHLGGDAFGVGGRVGAMYRAPSAPGLKLGVMYRTPVKLDFEGQGDFDIGDPYRSQLPPDGDISTSITLPQQVWGGIAYSPLPELEVEVDAVWIDWSSFKELRIALPGGIDTVAVQNYQDTVTVRVGAEYKLEPQNLALRAGFIYDPTPIPSTSQTAQLPDIDRKNVTAGASMTFGNYAAHLGLLWVTPGSRETSDELYMPQYKGEYHVQAFVASLGLTGHFDH